MLRRAWNKVLRVLSIPSGVGGAFLGLTLFQLETGGNRIAGLVVGWLYGASIRGLMRLLPVPPGWYGLAGFFAGPIPIALLMPDTTANAERGVILLGCLVGGLLGLLEAAHWQRSRRLADAVQRNARAPAEERAPMS